VYSPEPVGEYWVWDFGAMDTRTHRHTDTRRQQRCSSSSSSSRLAAPDQTDAGAQTRPDRDRQTDRQTLRQTRPVTSSDHHHCTTHCPHTQTGPLSTVHHTPDLQARPHRTRERKLEPVPIASSTSPPHQLLLFYGSVHCLITRCCRVNHL